MKRGQVTVYVIIGIFILLVILLYLLLRPDTEYEMEELPADFSPVQEHVVQCLEDTTLQALKYSAMHGGYIDPLDPHREKPFSLNVIDPTASDLIKLNPADNESAVPYWYYLSSANDCRFCVLSSLTPPEEQMRLEVQGYVWEHLHDCLNFGMFSEFTIEADDDENLEVTFFPDSVRTVYERRISMTKDGQTHVAKTFVNHLDVPFMRYYDMARAITQKEISTQFLENYMLYLITAYSGIGRDLPPIGGYDEGREETWVLFTVQQKFQQLLYSVTPSLQVLETRGVQPLPVVNDPYVEGYLRMTYLDLFDGLDLNTSKYRVSFLYQGWPLYLKVNPSKGQILKPIKEKQSGVLMIPPRQQNYYNFFYDVSAPFIIEIRDENVVNGQDFSFIFALEANVRENKNMVEWLSGHGTVPWDNDFVEFNFEDPADTQMPPNISVPNGTGPPAYEHNESITTLLCDESQSTTRVEAQVFDAGKFPPEPLPDVEFTYKCGLYAACDVGYSEMDDYDIYAIFKEKLPTCIGGQLIAEKEGYNTVTTRLTTRPFQSVQVPPIMMWPFVKRQVRFEKIQVDRDPLDEDTLIIGAPAPLDDEEIAFVNFVRQDDYGEAPVGASALLGNGTNMTMVSLIPGQYEVRAFYIDQRGRFVPEKCKKVCVDRGIFGCSKHEWIPNETINITPAPWGGLEFSEENPPFWHLEDRELYLHDELVVPLFVSPEPRCIDDLEDMGAFAEYGRKWRDEGTPRME